MSTWKRVMSDGMVVWLLALGATLVVVLSAVAAPMRQDEACLFFTETALEGGFSVCDDAEAEFRSAFERWGLQKVGYPISRRYERDGFVTQAFQKAIMQWRSESNQVVLVNIFDDLHNDGFDDTLLLVRQTPKQLPDGWDGEISFSEVVKKRQALLDERAALQEVYFASSDPLTFYGLPTSEVQDMDNHYAIRLQRAVLQEWKEEVPWAKEGEVTIANGGDIAKELDALPAAALIPEQESLAATPSATPEETPPSATSTPPSAGNGNGSGTPDLSQITVALEPIVTGFTRPLGVASPLDESGRLFVVEKDGLIWVVTGATDPKEEAERQSLPFLDLRPQISTAYEEGLLGLVFEPGRPERFYVNYTDSDDNTIVARYQVGDNPNFADPNSAEVLLRVPQPNATHNGGHLLFGPDGYLWIGLGDGGGTENEAPNGQDPYTLLGSMLRIDVSSESGYTIPPDNPFADGINGRPEIWAIGFRNPWRYSIDPVTGDLWTGDVGHAEWEEINRAPSNQPALNYGWSVREGDHCFKAESCPSDGYVVPITEYNHNEGCSVTGGYVYRGNRYPQLQGAYFFGDFCNGNLWAIDASTPAPVAPTLLLESGYQITSFAEDEARELYIIDFGGGLYRLVAQ
ncbi:MAG: PQQ-dependent sugar dehydrogenase [Ardenticatenaceae bacterium]